jgi:hypothetical protein
MAFGIDVKDGWKPLVGRCRLTTSKSVFKGPMVSAFETTYDEALSNFAINFHVRRYTLGETVTVLEEHMDDTTGIGWRQGCHLSTC